MLDLTLQFGTVAHSFSFHVRGASCCQPPPWGKSPPGYTRRLGATVPHTAPIPGAGFLLIFNVLRSSVETFCKTSLQFYEKPS